MVILSTLEEKGRISVTTEFTPRSCISILPAPLKYFVLGIPTKAATPPACSLSVFQILGLSFPLCTNLSFSHFCTERMLDAEVWIKPARPLANFRVTDLSAEALFAATIEGRVF